MEKRVWIEKYFGLEFTEKLIISANKGLLKGDLLIDDQTSIRVFAPRATGMKLYLYKGKDETEAFETNKLPFNVCTTILFHIIVLVNSPFSRSIRSSIIILFTC